MSPAGALVYLGGAAGYAAALTLLALGLAWLAGRPPRSADAALLLATLFVVFLALHPFPDPAALDCTDGGKPIRTEPFRFTDAFRRFWIRERPLEDWLSSRAILAPVMNVLLFALPGAALALHTRSWTAALGFGIGLSLFNELSQLTALWGIYPCRYRFFEVDDLILNPIGVLLGFAALRALRRGRGRRG